jgi:hypothetical protein
MNCFLLDLLRARCEESGTVHKFLSLKGKLAAIVSEGTFHRKDKKATAFRHFLATSKAQVVSLPAGAFTVSGTEVKCRMIRVEVTS